MIAGMARLALLALAVLAPGCPAGDLDDYPIGGGGVGGGPTGPGRTDGGIGGDAGTDGAPGLLSGRVCVVSDLRRLVNAAPGDCAATGANGLTVVLGGSAPVLTGPDGSFTIRAQEGSNLAWRVTGLNLVTSIVPVSASALLPAIGDLTYNDLLNSNSILIDQGEGSIVARLLRGGAPAAGATAAVPGGEALQTFYDGNNPIVWSTLGTGALGVAWLPDNVAGARTLRITQGATQLEVPITIVDQAITFVTIALP